MENKDTISRHFKKIENKTDHKTNQIRNVDFIYLINLDKRVDRLKRCRSQFLAYEIFPHRVSGIDGWKLSQEVFDDIAMLAEPFMQYDRSVQVSFVPGGTPGRSFDPSIYGKRCLHNEAPAGGMGCSLTHLSILEDAYSCGYETIWVLEDDFTINGNPHDVADWIDRLDHLTGHESWDMIYTDDNSYYTPENVRAHCGSDSWLRPGMPMTSRLIERRPIGNDFFKIGGRTQAHSYVIRRSGIEKILDFVKENCLFFPFDTELPCIEDLQLFNLKYDLVHGKDRTYSDTYYDLSRFSR